MDAEDFRNLVGNIQEAELGFEDGAEEGDQDGEDQQKKTKKSLENIDRFATIVLDDVKVLCRANSDDKTKMVVGLRNCDKTVAVTGDGIHCIDALEEADVGLAMGSGCSAVKNVSSLILTTDDFESAIRACMWGRNIYHNIGRFLQFQLTVNISVLLVVIAGIILFGECPLNAVQLLWINLIMDTFAAIALSTEPPMEKILRAPPTSNTSILTAQIWRQVMGISFWNFLIILGIYIFGGYFGDLESFSNYGTEIATVSSDDACEDLTKIKSIKEDSPKLAEKCEPYWASQMKLKLFTYVLCTFTFLQVFNYINCRKIGQSELNAFEYIFTKFNWQFWFTIVFVTAVQIIAV